MISRLIDKVIDKLADVGGKTRMTEMKWGNIPEETIRDFRDRIAEIFAMKNPTDEELIALLHREIGGSGIANLAKNTDILENHAKLAHYQRLKSVSLALYQDIQKAMVAHNEGLPIEPWESAYCILTVLVERWLPEPEAEPEPEEIASVDPV